MPIDLAVVPVAGRGTRLLPLTKSQPKEQCEPKPQEQERHSDQGSRKAEGRREEGRGERREDEGRKGKKEGGLRGLMKQVASQIIEERKRSSLPASAATQIAKAPPMLRLIEQF